MVLPARTGSLAASPANGRIAITPPPHPLADVVLRLALEAELDSLVEKGAEALAGAPRVVTGLALLQRRPDSPIRVVYGAARRRRRGGVAVARGDPPAREVAIRLRKDIREVERGFGVLLEQLGAADHLLQ